MTTGDAGEMPRYSEEWKNYLNAVVANSHNEQVAIPTGLSTEYVRRMRKDGLIPSLEVIEGLANAYGLDPKEVRKAASYPVPAKWQERYPTAVPCEWGSHDRLKA